MLLVKFNQEQITALLFESFIEHIFYFIIHTFLIKGINMTKLDMLYNLANKHNIQIHFFDLTITGCLGLNIEKENMPSMIFLDNSLKKDKNKHIEVLAEELGHFFTSVGISVGNIKTYSDKLELNRVENKADKWATNFLITDEEIINLINKNITDINEMAEVLSVPYEIVLKKLKNLSITKQYLDLGNGKYLMLTNFPNLIIYQDIL